MHPLDGDGADSVRALIRPAAEPSTPPDDATLNQKKSRRFFPLILNVAKKKKKKKMILSRNFLYTVYTHRGSGI